MLIFFYIVSCMYIEARFFTVSTMLIVAAVSVVRILNNVLYYISSFLFFLPLVLQLEQNYCTWSNSYLVVLRQGILHDCRAMCRHNENIA